MTIQNKETSDIGLAAAFSALGAEHVSTDKTDTRNMVFKFKLYIPEIPPLDTLPSPVTKLLEDVKEETLVKEKVEMDMDAWETAWTNRKLQVNAYEYFDALRRLKSVIHSK